MKTIKVLTIGNSFAVNALKYLPEIAEAGSAYRFEIGCANLGGCTLAKHWNLARYTASNPEFKPYNLGSRNRYAEPVEVTLQEALAANDWDFVTLQQASAYSWRPETFQPALGNLHALVRELAPRAPILLHQTWAYRSDSPFLPQNGLTQELMYNGIRAAYERFSNELDCRVLPSGSAVQIARRSPGRSFVWPEADYDYQRAEAPALPKQKHSLAVGWIWNIVGAPDGIPQLQLDANHLNDAGCFLAGCVWFEGMTGVDARETSFRPESLDESAAAFLRECAHAAYAT